MYSKLFNELYNDHTMTAQQLYNNYTTRLMGGNWGLGVHLRYCFSDNVQLYKNFTKIVQQLYS